MLRKALAAVLLIALCLGFLAVQGISQAPPPVGSPPADTSPALPGAQPTSVSSPFPPPRQAEPSFAELVQQLKNVQAQQETLKQQEKQLLDQIAKKVDEQRKELQKAEQLLQQLRLPATKPPRVPQKDKQMDTDKKSDKIGY
jgi:hypothetical protein